MKSNQKKTPQPKDTPATRKKRLQQRLQELSTRSDQELSALMKTVEKVKSTFRNDKNKP